ncbi:MAG: Na+/H+ antiporter subunit E [Deltaproteobacteria bacterium]|jgi:multisubunit Na+/H+ antiporter MnhE subunit|nr:Na+/H+ antiporter subunit E [Deltaproteobacteria bacterium]MBW2534954.1 Na+/H+ antiporter subunit E [Deltaproteobacteria bacterium]
MTGVLLCLLTLLAWVALRGDLGPSAWFVTAAVAVLLLLRPRSARRPSRWSSLPRKALAALHVTGLFAYELVVSNAQQLRVVFGPSRLCEPHWLHFRTELEHPSLRALLGVLISLTPGTLTCEIDADGTVWVYVLVAEDDAKAIARLRRVLEAPLRRLES